MFKLSKVFILPFFLFFFSFFFFSTDSAFACITTGPTVIDRQPIGSCDFLSCANPAHVCEDGRLTDAFYSSLVRYFYTNGTHCTQTEFFQDDRCSLDNQADTCLSCSTGCNGDSQCVSGASCVGGLDFDYCTQGRNGEDGSWCVSWACGVSCDNQDGCQPISTCQTGTCTLPATRWNSPNECNDEKAAKGGFCPCPAETCPTGYTCNEPINTCQQPVSVAVTCSGSPNPAQTNRSVAWDATVSRGTAPYRFSWTGTDGLSGSSQSINKTYTTAGTKNAIVTVTDANNREALNNCTVTVVTPTPTATPTPTLAPGHGSIDAVPEPNTQGTTGFWQTVTIQIELNGFNPNRADVLIKAGDLGHSSTARPCAGTLCQGWTELSTCQNVNPSTGCNWNPNGVVGPAGTYTFGLFTRNRSTLLATDPVVFFIPSPTLTPGPGTPTPTSGVGGPPTPTPTARCKDIDDEFGFQAYTFSDPTFEASQWPRYRWDKIKSDACWAGTGSSGPANDDVAKEPGLLDFIVQYIKNRIHADKTTSFIPATPVHAQTGASCRPGDCAPDGNVCTTEFCSGYVAPECEKRDRQGNCIRYDPPETLGTCRSIPSNSFAVCGTSPNGGNMYCGSTNDGRGLEGICSDLLCKDRDDGVNECNDGNSCTLDFCYNYAPFDKGDKETGPSPEYLGNCVYGNRPPDTVCQGTESAPQTKCSAANGPSGQPYAQCTVGYVSCTNEATSNANCCGTTNIQGNGCQGECRQAFGSMTGTSPLANVVIHVQSTSCPEYSYTRTTDAQGRVFLQLPASLDRPGPGGESTNETLEWNMWADVPNGATFTRGQFSRQQAKDGGVMLPIAWTPPPNEPRFDDRKPNKSCSGNNCAWYGMKVDFGFKLPVITTGTISGEVFVDDNRNGRKGGGETCYNSAIRVTTTNVATGATLSDDLASGCNWQITRNSGTYEVTFSPPTGYILTTDCGTYGCAAPGRYVNKTVPPNVTDVTFAISAANPWFQAKEGDVRSGGSISTNQPTGTQFSLNGAGGFPGVVFYGQSGTASFGSGTVSSRNWLAQENYAQTVPSYASLLAQAQRSGVLTPLGCDNCGVPAASGVYSVTGDLTINSWTVPSGRNLVIFVPGNLNVQGGANQTNIDVAAGGFLAFVVRGNISVNSSVGYTNSATATSNLEGWYITDGNFNTVDSGSGNRRLNIEGLILLRGQLVNSRDLGRDNLSYPSLSVSYRADLGLHAPAFMARPALRWEEIAP